MSYDPTNDILLIQIFLSGAVPEKAEAAREAANRVRTFFLETSNIQNKIDERSHLAKALLDSQAQLRADIRDGKYDA